MRTAGDIKSALIFLRFDKSKRLPLSLIAENSRCSPQQIMEAMRLEASELILRRLDAYLDAKHLHEHVKGTRILDKIERLKNEMWREFQAQSIPMRDMQLLSPEKQKRMLIAMTWRAKRLLRERVEKQEGIKLAFSDGITYWQAKAKVQARTGQLAADGNSSRGNGSRPVGQGGNV